MFTSLILDWVISLNDLLCRNELLYFNAIIAADVWFITSIMSDSRPSYLKALSPSYYHADLNASLEALVMGTRKNLLEALETQNYLEDECATDLNDFGEETLKVFLRIRPLTEQEKNAGEDKQCIRLKDSCTICATAPPDSWSFRNAQNLGIEKSSEFSFSRVLDVHAKQDDVFDVTALDLAKDFIVGRNVLMFCYGVTNAGKTFTIQGNEFEPGLIPRTLLFLFAFVHSDLYHDPCFLPKFANDVIVANESDKRALLQKREHLMRLADIEDFEVFLAESNLSKISSGSESSLASSCSSNTDLNDAGKSTAINSVGESFSGYKYLIWISFAEIYNEYVYDLLETLPTTEKSKRRSVLKLSEDKKGNVYLKGLTEICVSSCEEALKVLSLGQKNLRFASTKLNYNSSRSHCIYTVRLMRLTCQDDKLMVVRSSKFSFCDLAGSERTSKTGSTGERLKEAGSINTSLLNLGCCITALRYNQCHKERSQIIPFRNSKLTRLFQNFLVGRGKACMVVNISPCASSFDETWQVLQFSAIAKQVKQKSVDITLNSGPLCQIKNAANKNVKGGSEYPVGRDMENIDDSLLETTLAGDGALVQQLEVIIEDLKSQLLEERKKNLTIEQSVRNELCEKFAAQLMAMNERQIEMMDRQSDRVEDLADERIEFYVQTMKKQQNKEQRRMTMSGNYSDDEEESWVPEKVLRAERVENERLRKQIEEGRVVNEKFNNANDETAELKQQIENLTQQLAQKTKECKELDEMLGEAGSKYQENQAEIEVLKKNHAIVVERLEMELVAARRETDRLKSQLTAEPRGGSLSDTDAAVSTQLTSVPGSGQDPEQSTGDGGFKLIELESKIFELEKNAEGLHRDNASLKCNERTLTERLADLEKQLTQKTQVALSSGQWRTQLQKSEQRVEELEKQLKECLAKEAKMRADRRKAEDDLKQKSTALHELELSKEEWSKRDGEVKKRLAEMEAKYESAIRENNQLLVRFRQFEQESAEIQRLRDECAKKLEAKEKSDVDLTAKKEREIFDLKTALETTKFNLSEKEKSFENLMKQKDGAEKALEQLKTEFARKETENEGQKKSSHDSFDALKKSLEQMSHNLFQKESRLIELEDEKKKLNERLASVEETRQKAASDVETFQKLQRELDAHKQQVLEIKKEKLAVSEQLAAMDAEFKTNKNRMAELATQLIEAQKRNHHVVEESKKNESLIVSLKAAISNHETAHREMQNAFCARNEEIARLNEEQRNLMVRVEKAENNVLLIQKENSRLKSEIELKREIEGKMKITIDSLKNDVCKLDSDLKAEKKKSADLETRVAQKSTEESANAKRLIEEQMKTIAALQLNVENLVKELKAREAFIESLNEKLSEKERINSTSEKNLAKMDAARIEALAERDKLRETADCEKEALKHKIDSLENDRIELETKLKTLQKAAEAQYAFADEKIAVESKKLATSLPPASGKRRARISVALQEDETNQVELTPMISKKMSQSTAASGSRLTQKTEQVDSYEGPDFIAESTTKKRGRRFTAVKSQQLQDSQEKPPPATASSANKVLGRPRAARGRRAAGRAIGVLMEDCSPFNTLGPLRIESEAFDTPHIEKMVAGTSGSSERLSRRAKSTARNGIFAITEYLRNSPGSSTSALPTKKIEIFDDLEEQSLPPKKRRRNLYKSPEAGLLKTPPGAELSLKPTTSGRKTRKGHN